MDGKVKRRWGWWGWEVVGEVVSVEQEPELSGINEKKKDQSE